MFVQCPCRSSGKIELEWKWSDVIDKAYCICLQERNDRFEASHKQFHSVGLCKYVTYYRPTKDLAFPGRGMFASHRAVHEYARDVDGAAQRIAIFEDDVWFTSDLDLVAKQLRIIAKFQTQEDGRKQKKWDIIYLGHLPIVSMPLLRNRDIVRCFSFFLHAYIVRVHSTWTSWIISRPVDQYDTYKLGVDIYPAFKARCYACVPQIAWQSGSPSDCNKKQRLAIANLVLRNPKRSQTIAELCSFATLPTFLSVVGSIVYALK